MRPGAPSAFYRTKRTECSAMDVKFNRVCACYGGIRGLRIVARKSYGRIAMDSCLVAQCSNGLCLAALKTTAYTCPVGVLASCVESPIRTAPFRNFETAALCCCASANVVVHVIGCEKFNRVSSKLPFVLFAPLRDLDYSFRKNLAHCTRVSRASKSAARFLNPVPSDIQCRCKHLNSLGIKSCLWVNKLSCFDHRMPHLSQVPGARRFDEGDVDFPFRAERWPTVRRSAQRRSG
jgi:hypothetical protein